ncbi:hypothetical protein QYE76_050701 [Lolium multiflorum]|uniref:Uncharacterized protein n=1 Tax=Lolium multiflorum TaxID=4521 RepID=A0AAD8WH85_LOLMU|nr:hypothetical protein QYE76_050701 [Lolium multiflorum]
MRNPGNSLREAEIGTIATVMKLDIISITIIIISTIIPPYHSTTHFIGTISSSYFKEQKEKEWWERFQPSKAEEVDPSQKLAEANKLVDTLAQKLEQSETARKKAELDASHAKAEAEEAKAKAAGVEDLQKRLDDAETALNEHKAAQATREKAIIKRLTVQNRRFLGKTNQDFELEDPDNDPLLDALSFLEFHGTEVREGMEHADAGLSKLFPYFFPKKEEPKTFLALARDFNPPEDLGLKMRQENMKIAVETFVALVADKQTIDGRKLATPK